MPTDAGLVALLDATASAVIEALGGVTDWGLARVAPTRVSTTATSWPTKPRSACSFRGGVGVLSEESGLHDADRDIVVVVDPLDGSTNAAHGIPWYAVSLCAVDAEGRAGGARHQPRDGRAVRGHAGRAERRERRAHPPVGCDAARHVTDRPFGISAPAARLEAVPRRSGRRRSICAPSRADASTGSSTAATTPTAHGTTWAACWSASRPAR